MAAERRVVAAGPEEVEVEWGRPVGTAAEAGAAERAAVARAVGSSQQPSEEAPGWG